MPIAGTNYTLRRVAAAELTPTERREIFELYVRAFNGEPNWFRRGGSASDAFEWKALEAPEGATLNLVEDGPRLAGVDLAMGKQFLLRGRPVVVSDGVDSAIDPDYQGQGLDAKRKAAAADLPPRQACLVIWFATHPTSQVRRGVTSEDVLVLDLQTIAKPLSLRALIRRRAQRRTAAGGSRTAARLGRDRARRIPLSRLQTLRTGARVALARLRSPASVARAELDVESVTSFDGAMESFWAKASAGWDLIQKRDESYLNWRYADSRAGGFTLRVAREENEIVGFTVSRLSHDDAVLADLLALPDRADVVNLLLSDVTDLARQAGAPSLRSWVTESHPYRDLFRAGGFVDYETPLSLGLSAAQCPIDELAALVERGARVHLMPGDSDHV